MEKDKQIERRDVLKMAVAGGAILATNGQLASAAEGKADSNDMDKRVKDAIKDTKEFLNKAHPDAPLTDDDFAYITADLLRYYDQYAKPKDEEQAKLAKAAGLKSSLGKQGGERNETDSDLLELWTYYGHHVTVNGATFTAKFINSNASSGPDSPSDRCWGYNAWEAPCSVASPSSACPANSQGHNTAARGMR